MFGIGPLEMMIIGVIMVLLFGTRLPKTARSIGQSFNALKEGLNESVQ